MKKSQSKLDLVWVLMAVVLAVAWIPAAEGAVIVKENNTSNLNLPASWVGGVVPGSADIAQWDSTVAANTVALGADMSLQGINIDASHSGNITITTGNTLTLGASGIMNRPNIQFGINAPITLAAPQTWYAQSQIITVTNQVETAGYTLSLDGANTKQFKGPISGGGDIIVKGVSGGSSALKLTGSGARVISSSVTVNSGAYIQYDTAAGISPFPRTQNVTLNGGIFTVAGNTSADTIDTNQNALTIGPGSATITITPVSTKKAQLYSGSFVRDPSGNGVAIIRGTSLGVVPASTMTSNTANLILGAPPAMLGGGGVANQTTINILPGAYGDTNAANNGMGLVTYDSTYGVRLLNFSTEFTSFISDGQTQLDNVRYVNTSGSGVINTPLTADTTINSLSFNETGTGTNTGVTIVGDTPGRQLTLYSGCVFAKQIVGFANASDAMTLTNLTLNLNGREGVFITFSTFNTGGQGNTPAPLYIYGTITNDGGKGVTIGGSGQTIFAGSTTNTYTGVTTLNNGVLRLNKSVLNMGIPGDLVINGGSLLKNGNSIPDTANVTINGGTLYFDTTFSSGNGGHPETFNNLIMNGGSVAHHGLGAVITINGNATINAGDLLMNQDGKLTVLGTTTLNGGRLVVNSSSVTTATNTLFTLNGLVLSNQVSGVYTAVVMSAQASNKAGKLLLSNDVTFVNTTSNTNALFITSSDASLSNQGFIALGGARTFNVGDGAAAVDLAITPVIANNGTNVGGLAKTGAGTLLLSGANLYTGPTIVSNGTLILSGSLASPVTVTSNAVFTGTGVVSVAGTALTVNAGGIVDPGSVNATGTLSVAGNVVIANGGRLRLDAGTGGADLLAVSGTVTAGSGNTPVRVTVNAVGNGPWVVMTASSISGSFVADVPDMILNKNPAGTELWLYRGVRGSVLMIQ